MLRGRVAGGRATRAPATDAGSAPLAGAAAPSGADARNGSPRSLRAYYAMLGLFAALATGFVGAAGWVVWRDYESARSEAAREGANVAGLLAGRVDLSFASVRGMLGSIHGVLRATERIDNPPHEALLGVIAEHMIGFPYVAAVVIVDRDGKVVFDTGGFPHDAARIPAQEYFLSQRDAEAPVPYLGFIARHEGEPIWYGVVAIRVFAAGEAASGVAIAVIDPRYFQAAIDRLRLGPEGGVAILHRAGRLLMRSSARVEYIVGQIYSGPVLAAIAARDKGSLFTFVPTEGKLRLISFEALPAHDLVVVVGQSGADVLAPVYRRLGFQVLLLCLVLVVMASGIAYTVREMRKRLKAQAQLQESEMRLRRLAANVPGILFTRVLGHDGKLRYPYRSPRMFQIYGVNPEAGRDDGREMTDFIHPDDRAGFVESIMASARDMAPWQYEARVRPSAGVERWVLSQAIPYRLADGTVAWDGISVDITAERTAREALKQALDKAETASRAKTAFLGHMSHELRTPLNAVIGFSDLMAAGIGGTLAPKQHDYVDSIGSSARHLLNIIEGLLEIARIERGETAVLDQIVDARGLVDAVMGMVQSAAQRAGVRLEATVDPAVDKIRVDPQAMRQVLLNLMGNAVQHTPAGGRVSVAARVDGGGGLVFAVSDSGKGIVPEQLARLRLPLESREAIRRPAASTGLGIGLHISRQLTELHGGRLDIESAPGQGTTVTVNLPPRRLVAESGTSARAEPV